MSHSVARVLVHLVFSTKHREPFLTSAIRTELFPYLAKVFQKQGCPALQVGGVEDHIHALFSLSRTQTLARTVEVLKTSSSKWLKSKPGLSCFYWQAGYGAFSVSESSVSSVRLYIQRQEEHHRTMSFQDELRLLFRKHHLDVDESKIWD